MCKHGFPPAYCAVCTRTIQPRPDGAPGRPDTRERRTYGGARSMNPRATTFKITRLIEPSSVDRSFDGNIRAAAKASIEGRFGKLRPAQVDYAAIKKLLRGE